MWADHLKRENVENSSHAGPSSKIRKVEKGSKKKLEDKEGILEQTRHSQLQLSIWPVANRILFFISEIVIHTLEGFMAKTIDNKVDFGKDELFEELSRNIISVFLKHTQIDEDTTNLLKKRLDQIINKFAAETDDVTTTFSKLGKNVESISQKLQGKFPHIECVQLMSKAIETNFGEENKWNSIISELEEINQNIEPRTLNKYEFFPSQEHFIPEHMKIHYYISSNQFHKMMSKMTNTALPKKQVMNPSDAIESITYIHNHKLEAAYTNQKEAYKQQKKIDQNGNVRELFLFHGTAVESMESIITSNFLVDCLPHQTEETEGERQRRKKAMLFGRGIYFSELPSVSLMYGSGLLLCKVMVGTCEMFKPKGEIPPEIPDMFDSREVIKDGVGIVHVVKKPSQILPYCIIKLKKESLSPMTKVMTYHKSTPQAQTLQHCAIRTQTTLDYKRMNNNFGIPSFLPNFNAAFGNDYKAGVVDNNIKITVDEMSLLTMDKYTSTVDTTENVECNICLENLDYESSFDETFGKIQLNTCGHKFHSGCIKRMVKGQDYIQCPVCRTIFGTKTGDQPLTGRMTCMKNSGTIPGYPNCGFIMITYMMMPGMQTEEHPHPGKPYHAHGFPRTAFLPDNQQGNKVLKMLIMAFQRRLTFTIGTSLTTGLDDYVVWNGIHHKTKLVENGDGHGYPDMEYLDKVTEELENLGVNQ